MFLLKRMTYNLIRKTTFLTKTMKKNTLLYLILIVLIVINGIFIYVFLNRPDISPTKQKGNPTEFIATELGFNEVQLEKLKLLDQSHRENMERNDNEIRGLKDQLFSNLSKSLLNASDIDSITSLIGLKEKEKDMNLFKHFRSIQEICDDDQKERLQLLLKDALRPIGRRGREGRPPPPRR